MNRSLWLVLSVGVLSLTGVVFAFAGFFATPQVEVVILRDESQFRASNTVVVVDKPVEVRVPQPAGYGTYVGKIVLDGKPPILPPLVGLNDPREDAECCRNEIPDETLVVDAKSSGIRNVFVYLTKAPAIHPDLLKSSQPEVQVRAENCRYVPHAIIARTDQIVMFSVADRCGHSAHAFPLKSASFCNGINLESAAVPLSYKIAEREPFPVKCDIHAWMKARWLILDHPYAALTDEEGKFRIEKLPAGDHQFVIWHEAARFIDKGRPVTINVDQTTDHSEIVVPLDRFKL